MPGDDPARPVGDFRVIVHPNAEAASCAAAQAFAALAQAVVDRTGSFAVALSGGSAPRECYRRLGEEPLRSAVPWEAVHLFWGDERCVPPAHPRSNFGMARDAMVRHLPIPAGNVHRMRGELPPAQAAAHYRDELAGFFGPGIPAFDLLHLGVGEDGHTCSLFPRDALLTARVDPVGVALYPAAGEWRLTLTPPVLNAAGQVDVLAHGSVKAGVVRSAMYGPLDPLRLPIQLVRPADGLVDWYVDRAAASALQ